MTEKSEYITNPSKSLEALIRLRGDLEERPYMWWYAGLQYGVADLGPQPLWRTEGLQIGRFSKQDDGSYNQTFHDIMFYRDCENDEFLTSFTNPYSNIATPMKPLRFGPFTTNYSTKGVSLVGAPPGINTRWELEKVLINGDDIIIREHGMSSFPNPLQNSEDPNDSSAEFMNINDFITLQGSVSDIVDSDSSCVAARHTYQSVNSWAPWMKMGSKEGFLMGRGNGRKLSSLEELPADIHEAILEHEPDMLKFVDAAPWQEVLSPSNQ